MRPKNMILPRRCTAVGSDRAILESFFGSRRGLQLEDLTTKRFQLTRSTSKLSEPPPAYRLERGGGGRGRSENKVFLNGQLQSCLSGLLASCVQCDLSSASNHFGATMSQPALSLLLVSARGAGNVTRHFYGLKFCSSGTVGCGKMACWRRCGLWKARFLRWRL